MIVELIFYTELVLSVVVKRKRILFDKNTSASYIFLIWCMNEFARLAFIKKYIFLTKDIF